MNRKEEEERERELERLVNEEVEKKWAHTMKQYRLERDARQKLLANVMKTRQEQIEERSKLNLNFIPLYYNTGVNKTGPDRIKYSLNYKMLVIGSQGLIGSSLIQVNCHSILSNLVWSFTIYGPFLDLLTSCRNSQSKLLSLHSFSKYA